MCISSARNSMSQRTEVLPGAHAHRPSGQCCVQLRLLLRAGPRGPEGRPPRLPAGHAHAGKPDGGQTFRGANGTPEYAAHADFHALWMDPPIPTASSSAMMAASISAPTAAAAGAASRTCPWASSTPSPRTTPSPTGSTAASRTTACAWGPSEPIRPGAQSDGWRDILGGTAVSCRWTPRQRDHLHRIPVRLHVPHQLEGGRIQIDPAAPQAQGSALPLQLDDAAAAEPP